MLGSESTRMKGFEKRIRHDSKNLIIIDLRIDKINLAVLDSVYSQVTMRDLEHPGSVGGAVPRPP